MAKPKVDQSNYDDLLDARKPTAAGGDRFDLDKGPTKATGLGMRTGELEAVDAIAAELGVSKNLLMRFAIRYVLKEYLAGRIDLRKWIEIPPEPKKSMRMP